MSRTLYNRERRVEQMDAKPYRHEPTRAVPSPIHPTGGRIWCRFEGADQSSGSSWAATNSGGPEYSARPHLDPSRHFKDGVRHHRVLSRDVHELDSRSS